MLLSGCGYQGWVRYPCQEYENWENAECQPPQCEAIGQCTKDLLPEVDTQMARKRFTPEELHARLNSYYWYYSCRCICWKRI
jgi:hypothetical protein